jgi:hypothetical protein
MLRNLVLAWLAAGLLATAAGPARAPVLVELFTSEGCSSCPPADQVLAALDPQAIVLGEHVDYWDHLGWRDRFSSHANTQRQESYARHFGIGGPYTPELVVDGAVEFNGSDGPRALQEIARARSRDKVAVHLSRAAAGLEIAVDAAPHGAEVLLAIAQDGAETQVGGGENNGRRLKHVAILRSLHKVGAVKKGVEFRQTIKLPAEAASGGRLIVFVQDADMGRVYGAALLE